MQIQISDQLNGIIQYAREEAMRTGSYGIGPDHLFLGMMRQADNEACKVLVGLGVAIHTVNAYFSLADYYNSEASQILILFLLFCLTSYSILSAACRNEKKLVFLPGVP